MAHRRIAGRAWTAALLGISLVTTALATTAWLRGGPSEPREQARTLIASIRSEPASFNPFTAPPAIATEVVTRLLHSSLVRIDRRTDEPELWLAERVVSEEDGVTYTVSLRPDLVFSDGTPVSSDDVIASFQAAADERGGSYLADSVAIRHKPIHVTAVDGKTVLFRFPAPYAPGIRVLADVPILPARELRRATSLEHLWPSTVSPQTIIGLGPFVLTRYDPGQRLVFARNPRYWRRDTHGHPLPYLDRLVLEIVADQNAELLRLQAGELDVMTSESRAEDVAILRRAAAAGRLRVYDLGPGLDMNALWFNLRPNSVRQDTGRAWLHRDAFRRAISHAIDRRVFADTVYLGFADPVYGPITSANARWYSPTVPTYPFDLARAAQLLASAGLRDRDADGVLEDERGAAVRFALLTQAGNTLRESGARFIRDELRRIGIEVDVVPLAAGALFARFESGDYEAMYFGLQSASTEPAEQLDFWLSSGHYHLWHPSQERPARAWEQEIDRLMEQQMAVIDPGKRKQLFDRAQHILGTHTPIMYFAAPRVVVAVSSRVRNVTPALTQPQVLWNPDTLTVQ